MGFNSSVGASRTTTQPLPLQKRHRPPRPLGYLVIAPDFYHRIEPGVELMYDQAGRTKGFGLLHQISREDAVQDARSAMCFLGQRSDFRGRIGFLGFSVGGHIGYLAATRQDLAACAIFYAVWLGSTDIGLSRPEPTLALTPGMAKNDGPILFFVGDDDFLVTPRSARRSPKPSRQPAYTTK